MKTLSACLYCAKKKECTDSIKSHSFIDSCYVPENGSLADAIMLLHKANDIAELLIKQSISVTKLAQKIITDGCASVCFHAGESCEKETECFACEEPCPCRDCWDGEKLKIDWSKLNET